jgi:preprotein translocase subunit YajC
MNRIVDGFLPLLAPPAGGAGAESMVPTLITFGAVFAIFYFLIIRPQNKKQKETQKMLEALKKGDKVQTIGGIRGVIASIKDDSVVVKVDDNAKIEFVRSAVSAIVEVKDDKKEPKKETKKEKEEETAAE